LHFDGVSRPRNPRVASAIATVAVHVALFAILLIPNRAEPQSVRTSLSLFDVNAISTDPKPEPAKAPQPKPVKPTPPQPVVVPPPEIVVPNVNTLLVAMLDQTESAKNGGACDLTAPVQAALQSSDAVRASLPLIPPDKRSVANAIMVWKLAWLAEDQQLGGAAITAIRDVIAETIAAATPECRLQPQAGPRLLLLAGTGDTVVLAVGSGEWRWQDLLDTAHPELTGEGIPGVPPSATIFASADAASVARR
jgi:hypothetical protein